ncbi:MAG: hypothetical protein EXS69_00105 [Candidatus Zambryskibacteria bacterium]|nr:hypothetical protein [Candidatus Zambryskibacteria bacterium]
MLAAIIVYCLVHRYAPDCTGGCLSHPAPVATASRTFIVTAGSEWTKYVRVPMSGTSEIRWERVDQNTAYQFRTQAGVPVTRNAGLVPHTDHGRVQKIQFRAVDSNPVYIRVTIVE